MDVSLERTGSSRSRRRRPTGRTPRRGPPASTPGAPGVRWCSRDYASRWSARNRSMMAPCPVPPPASWAQVLVRVETFVVAADGAVDRVAGLRGAHVVPQADVDDYRAAYPIDEVVNVVVVENVGHRLPALGVRPDIVVDLLVRVRAGQRRGVHHRAQVWRAGRRRRDFPRAKGRDEQRQCAALAGAPHGDSAPGRPREGSTAGRMRAPRPCRSRGSRTCRGPWRCAPAGRGSPG